MGNAARDIEPTSKTSRELFGMILSVITKVNKVDGILDERSSLYAITYIQRAKIVNVFINCELIKDGNILWNDANTPFQIIACRLHVLAKQLDGASIVGEELQHTIDSCCFATTIWSEQSKNLSRCNVEREVVQRNGVSITLDQSTDGDEVV